MKQIGLFCFLISIFYETSGFGQVQGAGNTPPAAPDFQVKRIEISVSHINDVDFMGGNDRGLSFGEKFKVRVFGQSQRQATRLDFEIGNSFYSGLRRLLQAIPGETEQDPPQIRDLGPVDPRYDRDDTKRLYINYVEQIHLKVAARMQDLETPSDPIQFFTELGFQINYETTRPTASGARLQRGFHSRSGLDKPREGFLLGRSYNYRGNQWDRNAVDFEFKCSQGVELDLGNYVTCTAQAGATLRTIDFKESSLDLNARVGLHTFAADWLERQRPTVGVYGFFRCSEYVDFKQTDIEAGAGIEANFPIGNQKLFRCLLEYTRPIEQNDTRFFGMNDEDHLLQLEMGIAW